VTDDLVALGLARPRSAWPVWAAVVVALLLGLTIGVVFFGKQKEPEKIIQYVTVPAQGASAAASQAAVQNAPPPEVAVAGVETKKTSPGAPGARPAGGSVGPPSTIKEEEKAPLAGLKGLSGLSAAGPNGPSGSGASAPAGGGAELDGAQVQSTVARYTGSVKRACWQPAVDARDPSAPSGARVVVTITVAPSGSVEKVSTSGDPDGYPGLANCIAGRVRGWQFPPSSGSTTVKVPFGFVAQ
jgi:hypothetical protein